jgi:hypothetical protein
MPASVRPQQKNIAPQRRMRDARPPARAIAMIEMSYQRSWFVLIECWSGGAWNT